MGRKGRLIGGIMCWLWAAPGNAVLVYDIMIDDPSGSWSAYYADLQSHVVAAGDDWGRHLKGDARLQVIVKISDTVERATGRSLTSAYAGKTGDYSIWRQGVAEEIITGDDPNGDDADIEFVLNPDYLSSELWFDTDPLARSAPVGTNRTDAMSVFLHEFGHALAFNGWRDDSDGSLPGDFASSFDEQVIFDGKNLFFTGAQAEHVHGNEVPLTIDNYGHLGNLPPGPGAQLVPDLMNGELFEREKRYYISRLDLAILADTGFDVVVPVPPAAWLLVSGMLGMVFVGRRGRDRARAS